MSEDKLADALRELFEAHKALECERRGDEITVPPFELDSTENINIADNVFLSDYGILEADTIE